jgi:hypothetical protein
MDPDLDISEVAIEEFLHPHYHMVVTLMLTPGIILLLLMFKGATVGEDKTNGLDDVRE